MSSSVRPQNDHMFTKLAFTTVTPRPYNIPPSILRQNFTRQRSLSHGYDLQLEVISEAIFHSLSDIFPQNDCNEK